MKREANRNTYREKLAVLALGVTLLIPLAGCSKESAPPKEDVPEYSITGEPEVYEEMEGRSILLGLSTNAETDVELMAVTRDLAARDKFKDSEAMKIFFYPKKPTKGPTAVVYYSLNERGTDLLASGGIYTAPEEKYIDRINGEATRKEAG